MRVPLNNNYEFTNNWELVIELFKQRIENFYFDTIKNILKPNSKKGEGFAIVTLQCALIEMLAAFKYGKIHNPEKIDTDPEYEYKDSTKYFIKFLKNESLFENHFFIVRPNGMKHGNQPYDADDFYSNVRCGLMHEARTKKDWLITAKKQPVTPNKIFICICFTFVLNFCSAQTSIKSLKDTTNYFCQQRIAAIGGRRK